MDTGEDNGRRHEVERVCQTRLAGKHVLRELLCGLAERAISSPEEFVAQPEIDSWSQEEVLSEWVPETSRVKNRIRRLRLVLDDCNRHAFQHAITIEALKGHGYRLRFHPVSERSRPNIPRALRPFWEPIMRPGRSLIVYSNNEFFQLADGSLREAALQGETKHGVSVVELTGVGEAAAINDLARLYARCRVDAEVKRALSVQPAELSERNVVYVGSPFTNRRLRAMLATIWGGHPARHVFVTSSTAPFVFLLDTQKEVSMRRHDLSPDGGAWLDYALISRMRKPGGKVDLVLAGTSTFGTQAAAAFACDVERIKDLVGRLHIDPLACLQVVLEVKVVDGEPVEIQMLEESAAIHRCAQPGA